MPRSPCLFRETDVRRAVKAALSSGIDIARIEIGRDGRIILISGKRTETADESQKQNELDGIS
jgi:hypothetical protein